MTYDYSDLLGVGGAYILLIEDDADDRFFTLRTFERNHSPLTVLAVPDGEEALAFLRDAVTPPVVILLDSILPKLNGREVLSALRSDARTLPVPVILLSGERCDECFEWPDPPDANLTKPLQWTDLESELLRLGVLRQPGVRGRPAFSAAASK